MAGKIATNITNAGVASRLQGADQSQVFTNEGARLAPNLQSGQTYNPSRTSDPYLQQSLQELNYGAQMYPLGQYQQNQMVYMILESGRPIIMDPETGKPFPPGFIPKVHDKRTWEEWRPGDSWSEEKEKTDLQWEHDMQQFTENNIRPWEEYFAKLRSEFWGETGQKLLNFSKEFNSISKSYIELQNQEKIYKDAMERTGGKIKR